MDYRVEPGWHSHPKRRRLKRLLGADAVLALMDLWGYCANEAHERTDGDLTGMSDEDIADAAGWDGDAGRFVQVLVDDCRFLDGLEGHRQIHDWAAHQPWVAGFVRRQEEARELAMKGWTPEAREARAKRMRQAKRTASAPHSGALSAPHSGAVCSFPSPSPILSSPLPDPPARRDAAPPPPPQDATPFVAFVLATWPDVRSVPEAAWRDACPAVDLLAEARKAHAWELSQPASRRKRDHRRFLDGWLRRAQEKAATARPEGRPLRSVPSVPASPASAFKDEEIPF